MQCYTGTDELPASSLHMRFFIDIYLYRVRGGTGERAGEQNKKDPGTGEPQPRKPPEEERQQKDEENQKE